MSNKGEDVKQLFAHLGLDPSSYRDLKGEGDKDEVEGRVGKKRTAPANRTSRSSIPMPIHRLRVFSRLNQPRCPKNPSARPRQKRCRNLRRRGRNLSWMKLLSPRRSLRLKNWH